jgi:hypothetical protein
MWIICCRGLRNIPAWLSSPPITKNNWMKHYCVRFDLLSSFLSVFCSVSTLRLVSTIRIFSGCFDCCLQALGANNCF